VLKVITPHNYPSFSMSRILKVMKDAEVCKGDVMPWGNAIIEVGGDKLLICSGHTGRGLDMKQEYPEMLEQEGFGTSEHAALTTCPHSVEEQTVIALEKIDRVLKWGGTSWENVYYGDYYLTQRYNFPPAFRAMKKWFNKRYPDLWWFNNKRPYHSLPCVLTIVQGLDHPDMLIEIKMWATIPGGKK
jgi:enamine deaminase RidA (YjgF/YER057c/UK114 family)